MRATKVVSLMTGSIPMVMDGPDDRAGPDTNSIGSSYGEDEKKESFYDERSDELRAFLASSGREKFADALASSRIRTVDDLSRADVDELATAGLPKSIARLLVKKAAAATEGRPGLEAPGAENSSEEIRAFLAGIGREKFTEQVSSAGVTSVEGLGRAEVDVLAAAGMPKSIARLLVKKANAAVAEKSPQMNAADTFDEKAVRGTQADLGAATSKGNEEEVRIFLASIGREKCAEQVSSAGVTSVVGLARADVDELAAAGLPKSIARLLVKKASAAVA